ALSIDTCYVVDCVYSFLHNGGARFIPSPEGEGSSLPLHPDVITAIRRVAFNAALVFQSSCIG
ncbi:hypothetical protein, partial [Methanothrix sp.]|uniref:hypothetical protein n=1 Tax=Methanothrix sp. TaxID=90426 RepID=UPI003BB739DC